MSNPEFGGVFGAVVAYAGVVVAGFTVRVGR